MSAPDNDPSISDDAAAGAGVPSRDAHSLDARSRDASDPRAPCWRRGLARAQQLHARLPWLLPLLSFSAGWLGFVLVQRSAELARMVALIALIGWPWLLLEPLLRRPLERRYGRRLVAPASNFVTQSLQQELLFFSLPFLIGASQLTPGHILFCALTIGAALIATADPIYHRLVARRPARRLAFHAFCSWIAALVLLPMVLKLPLEQALPLSLVSVGVWLLITAPALLAALRTPRQRLCWSIGLIAVPLLLWSARAQVPAAGLSVTDARITRSIEQLTPGPAVERVAAAELSQGIVAFVAIRAPLGLHQGVVFEWHHGDSVERIAADIRGGSGSGWRTWSRKRVFPRDALGPWRVDVVTPQGQLLQRLTFNVY